MHGEGVGKEPPRLRIRANLAELPSGGVMLLCPCCQPGIFVCDNPQMIPAPGWGWDGNTPAQKHLGLFGFSIRNGSGEDKNKNLQEFGWDLGCFHLLVMHRGAGCRSPGAGSTQGRGVTELLAHFPQGNLTPCPWRPRRSPRAALTRT